MAVRDTRDSTPRPVWVQQLRREAGAVRWRAAAALPPSSVCSGSPDDEDAHDARKSTTAWVG